MLAGISFGLLSSLTLGVSDLTAGLLARHVGIVRGTAAALTISLILLTLTLALSGESAVSDPTWMAWIAGVGLLRAAGYFFLVRAFSIGPVAVVAPITASSGVVTVLASVVLLGDRPSALQWFAVGIATIGAVVVAVSLDDPKRRISVVGQGPIFALIAMLMLSTVVAAQQPPIRAVGWLPTITLRRAVEVAVTLGVFVVAWRVFPRFLELGRRATTPELAFAGADSPPAQPPRQSPSRGNLVARAAFVGVFDSVGLSSLAVSLALAPAWLFGISGSLSPLPGIVFGMAVLHERLRPNQWIGIALIVVALFLVGVG